MQPVGFFQKLHPERGFPIAMKKGKKPVSGEF